MMFLSSSLRRKKAQTPSSVRVRGRTWTSLPSFPERHRSGVCDVQHVQRDDDVTFCTCHINSRDCSTTVCQHVAGGLLTEGTIQLISSNIRHLCPVVGWTEVKKCLHIRVHEFWSNNPVLLTREGTICHRERRLCSRVTKQVLLIYFTWQSERFWVLGLLLEFSQAKQIQCFFVFFFLPWGSWECHMSN